MISFVIPALNEEGNIGLCLVAVCEEADRYDGPHEVIVVDNGSTDKTVEKVSLPFYKRRGVRIIHEPRKGVTRARQAGYKAALGDIICNIDADTVLPEGWLHHAIRALDGAVMATGPVVYYNFSPILSFFTRVFYSIGRIAHFVIGPMSMGGNTVIRTYALDMIGGYNTSFDFWGEDTDTAQRLSKIGKVKFSNDMWVFASSRRFKKEGVVTTVYRYVINYLWVSFFGKPYHTIYKDIRT